MRIWAALIIFCIGFSAAAGTKTCEAELSISAQRFLRTLRSGVAQGLIGPEDLQWLASRQQPADPIRQPRNPDTLFLKQKFRANISHISPQQWELVTAEAAALLKSQRNIESKIEEGREVTKHFFGIVPTAFKFPPSIQFLGTFTSTSGETITAFMDGGDTVVQNLSKEKSFRIESALISSPKNFDFFETSAGEILFAMNSTRGLTLHNAQTGEVILDLRADPNYKDTYPLIYESNSTLNIMMVTSGDQELLNATLEPKSGLAFRNLQFAPGQKEPLISDAKRFGPVVRLTNNHLYSRNLVELAAQLHVGIYDLTLKKEVLNLGIPHIEKGCTTPLLVFDSGRPKLLLKTRQARWYEVEPGLSTAHELTFLKHVNHAHAFLDFRERATNVRSVSGNDEQALFVQNIFGGIPLKIPLKTVPKSSNLSWQLTSLPTAQGLWTWGLEWNNNDCLAIILINLDTQQEVRIELPQTVGRVWDVYADSSTGKMYAIAGPNGIQWNVVQIYGPERNH